MADSKQTQAIVDTLKSKSAMKLDIFDASKAVFTVFKSELKSVADALKKGVGDSKDQINIEYIERGEFEAELRFAGDILIFYMHTNTFKFNKEHQVSKLAYVKEDEKRKYCSMISIYNFLADSFKYNRTNDLGYLIARIFVNLEKHFFVEGKGQLGFLYTGFGEGTIDNKVMRSIIERAILDTLDFDLLTPPYEEVKEVTVDAMKEASHYMKMKTGKRMGFSFKSDDNQPQ